MTYIKDLFRTVLRKNSWQLDRSPREAHPYGFPHLRGRATGSPDMAQEALYEYIRDSLADPQGVVIIGETEFLKQGTHAAGVAHQSGRGAHGQVGVFRTYAGAQETPLRDRGLLSAPAWD